MVVQENKKTKEDISVGDKIKFFPEKQRYTVRGCDSRFVICTKPFNLRKTYKYCILDLKLGIRSPDDRIFGPKYEYDDPEECLDALKDLNSGELELSWRNKVELDIERIDKKHDKSKNDN